MKTLTLGLWSAGFFTVAATLATPAALAQPAAPAASAAAAASAPARRPPPLPQPPRRLSPDEKRDSATLPGDLRPADAVTPQIKVPLGKRDAAAGPRKASAGDGIDDTVARCEASESRAERQACLDSLPKPKKKAP